MLSRIKILLHYIFRYKISYSIGLLALVTMNYFRLWRPRLLGNAIDSLPESSPAHPLHFYVAIFVLVVVCENGFRLIWRRLLVSSSRRAERDLMNDFFQHILKLDPAFFDRTPTGDLMARATNDISTIRRLLGPGMMLPINAITIMSGAMFMMFRLNVRLTFFVAIPIPFFMLLIAFLLRHVHKNFDKVQAQFSNIASQAQESISGIRVTKAHNRQEHEISQFNRVTSIYVKKFMHLTKFDSGIEPAIISLTGIGKIIAILVGGNAVLKGELTLGQLVEYYSYLDIISWPIAAVGRSANLFERGMASLKRIQAIMDEKPTINLHKSPPSQDNQPDAEAFQDEWRGKFAPGDIEFRNVSFQYRPETPKILSNVNLSVPRGSTLGIVGPLGCGKTTLLNLLVRLYDPTEGEIFIGGKNIADLPVNLLRQHVSYVPQEAFLFSRSISKNLNLGRQDDDLLGDDRIYESLELADLHNDVANFSNGLDTTLGERGVRLSGGQKQRMTIARALARNTDILILDDTLSSVDTDTESRIIGNFRTYSKGRTNLIVSHRISSVKGADHIIVLEEGKIVEQGTHDELISSGGFYATLFHQQQLQHEIEGM